MTRLNYHHLHYFWVVAREGSIRRACEVLKLSQPAISGQIRALERAIKVPLFAKSGRGLTLTEPGQDVFRFAEEIFGLGQDLLDFLDGRPGKQPVRLRVGIIDVMPKLIAHLLIQPAVKLPQSVRLICREGTLEQLTAELVLHNLDVLLTDQPLTSNVKARAYSHELGRSGVSIAGVPALVERYKPGFPQSLDRAPFLLPTENTILRRSLEKWFAEQKIRPEIRGEFEDSALLKAFARTGAGVFALPMAVEREARKHYGVRRIGRVRGLYERFFAISLDRRLKNPAVVAICEQARRNLSSAEPPA